MLNCCTETHTLKLKFSAYSVWPVQFKPIVYCRFFIRKATIRFDMFYTHVAHSHEFNRITWWERCISHSQKPQEIDCIVHHIKWLAWVCISVFNILSCTLLAHAPHFFHSLSWKPSRHRPSTATSRTTPMSSMTAVQRLASMSDKHDCIYDHIWGIHVHKSH